MHDKGAGKRTPSGLALTLREEDYVIICDSHGERVLLTITQGDIGAGKSRVHFAAPPHIQIKRGKVWEAEQAARQAAKGGAV